MTDKRKKQLDVNVPAKGEFTATEAAEIKRLKSSIKRDLKFIDTPTPVGRLSGAPSTFGAPKRQVAREVRQSQQRINKIEREASRRRK